VSFYLLLGGKYVALGYYFGFFGFLGRLTVELVHVEVVVFHSVALDGFKTKD
jgi:hypothetical protein